jgi:hypothetical protein
MDIQLYRLRLEDPDAFDLRDECQQRYDESKSVAFEEGVPTIRDSIRSVRENFVR